MNQAINFDAIIVKYARCDVVRASVCHVDQSVNEIIV